MKITVVINYITKAYREIFLPIKLIFALHCFIDVGFDSVPLVVYVVKITLDLRNRASLANKATMSVSPKILQLDL